MDTKVIYAAAAATSLDSWDFENLRYIRKISRNGRPSQLPGDMDAVSYISEQNEDLDSIPLPFLENDSSPDLVHNNKAGSGSSGSSRSSSSGIAIPNHRHSNNNNNNNNNEDESLIVPQHETMLLKSDGMSMLASESTAGRGLDDCYLLDVVTVRNESVMAFTSHSYPIDKHSAGSSSSPSSSSSASSVNNDMELMGNKNPHHHHHHHHSESKERDFFDLSLDMESLQTKPDYSCKDEFQLYRRHSPCGMESPSLTSVTAILSKENQRRNPIRAMAHCPFCDQSNPFFNNSEQSVNLEDISMQVTVGGEPPAAPPRSPSPYYVRLRRDLLSAITPAHNSFKINRPRNFSVNTQGSVSSSGRKESDGKLVDDLSNLPRFHLMKFFNEEFDMDEDMNFKWKSSPTTDEASTSSVVNNNNSSSRSIPPYQPVYPYECTDCHKTFRTKDKLNLHAWIHSTTKNFVCEKCDKAFKQPHSLYRHRQLHVTEKAFSCDQCGKSFKNKQSLDIHRWIHADKKQFKCNECEKEFQQPGALYRHRKIHAAEKYAACHKY